MASNRLYFFKVFLPNLSSTRLTIPPKFVKHLINESMMMMHLRGPTGKIWDVELVKHGDEMAFEKGWKKFAADHFLTTGDFVLFDYKGNSCFNVIVFDKTACEKETIFLAQNQAKGKRRREDHGASKSESLKKSQSSDKIEEKRAQVSSDDQHGRQESRTDAPCPRHGLRGRKKSIKCKCCDSGADKCSAKTNSKHIQVSQAEEQKIPEASTTPVLTSTHALREKKKATAKSCDREKVQLSQSLNSKNIDVAHFPKSGHVISRRRPVTEEEIARASQKAELFKSRHPFLKVVMHESNVYRSFMVYIPKAFARMHLPQRATELTLWDPKGKPWKVLYKFSSRQRAYLSDGWAKFSLTQHLEKSDYCIFELIKENEMSVRIFRVVEELTPFTRG